MSDVPVPADSATNPGRRDLLKLGAGASAGAGLLALGSAPPAAAAITNGTYFSSGPTRLLDTRISGGPISAGQTRTSPVLAGAEFVGVCNLVVVNTRGGGYLAIYSADLANRPNPYASVNWYGSNQVVGNLAIFDIGSTGIKIFCGSGSTDYILDFVGYFVAAPERQRSPEQLAFEERARQAGRRLQSGD